MIPRSIRFGAVVGMRGARVQAVGPANSRERKMRHHPVEINDDATFIVNALQRRSVESGLRRRRAPCRSRPSLTTIPAWHRRRGQERAPRLPSITLADRPRHRKRRFPSATEREFQRASDLFIESAGTPDETPGPACWHRKVSRQSRKSLCRGACRLQIRSKASTRRLRRTSGTRPRNSGSPSPPKNDAKAHRNSCRRRSDGRWTRMTPGPSP